MARGKIIFITMFKMILSHIRRACLPGIIKKRA